MSDPEETLKEVGFQEILKNLEMALKMQEHRESIRDPVYQIPYQAAAKLYQVLKTAGEQFIQDQNIGTITSVCKHAIHEVKPIMDQRLTLFGNKTAGSLYNIKDLEDMVDALSQNMSARAKNN